MAEGLELVPGSIKVYLYANKVVADADSNMDNSINNNVPVYNIADGNNANYILNTNPDNNHCSFEFTIADAKDIAGAAGGNAIVITYNARLTENAALGKAGNANSVYLEFSNDPYSNDTGKTAEDTVKVFTYGLTINKKDVHGHDLAGAGFTLWKYSANDRDYVKVNDELTGGTSFVWKGLDDGDYKLVETTVPDGYNAMEEITFTIQAAHEVDSPDPQLTAINSVVMGNGDDNGMITKAVVNHTGTVLPETGAEGTFFLITGGTLLVILAAVFMITRKKMSIYED
jgi:LPXTG-motif cell wall-anchored protein